MLNLFGLRPFAEPDAVVALIAADKNFAEGGEPRDQVRPLLIFTTSSQQTWLVFSPLRVYCILDDREQEKPVLRWSMDIKDLLKSPIKVRDYSVSSGKLDIGDRRNWLFSKRLFTDVGIDQALRMTAGDVAAQARRIDG